MHGNHNIDIDWAFVVHINRSSYWAYSNSVGRGTPLQSVSASRQSGTISVVWITGRRLGDSIFLIFYFITIQSSRITQLTQVFAFVTKQPVFEGAASSDVHFFENPVNICSKVTNVWDARSFQMIAIEMASSSVTLIHFYFKLLNNSKRLRKRDHLNGIGRVLKSNNCRRQKRFT